VNRAVIVPAALALVAWLAVSCGGGSDELAEAIEDLLRRDLETMVLTADEFDGLVDGFVIDPNSGTQDNAEAADDSVDPGDTASDFDDAGRITGYELTFGAPNVAALLSDSKGLITADYRGRSFRNRR